MKTPSTWWPAILLLSPTASAITTTPSAPAAAAAAAAPAPLTCDNILVPAANNNANSKGEGEEKEQHKYDLRALAGPHAVVTHEFTRPTYHNTTYAIDLCAPLKRKGEVEPGEACPDGTRVCAIKHRWDHKEDKSAGIDQVIPIVVGDEDKAITWSAKQLPKTGAQKGGKKEGLRLTLQGHTSYQERAQRTVVEFRCNPDLEGTENEWESVDVYEPGEEKKSARRAEEGEKKDGDKEGDKKGDGEGDKKDDKGDDKGDDDEEKSTPEKQLKKDGAALVWEGYKRESEDGVEVDTLYLTWYTKHVCDSAVDEPEPAKESSHWGFFTWLVILVFLATASYLIFGSWLNYNRYGARGWDLLPHGDTLRDAPYLMRDLIRKALNTLQSTGSRGGYSAV
ncbi:autophagy-related protein 27 [Chaetomium fimeti]|uniref:Autophagy-related protein 27 n=1 Tax=Chaetomium fimeti TaxID=1854472 RepID=A0AAE0HK31_9PEZI|nr:autophagy-related protein 27 [Chaetomium fimeti]